MESKEVDEEQTEDMRAAVLRREINRLRDSRKVYFIAGILLGMIMIRAFEYYF